LGHKHSLSICNVMESALPRESELVLYTRAGAEIGVASTKAFTTQLVVLFGLAVTLGKQRGLVSDEQAAAYVEELRQLADMDRREMENQYQQFALQYDELKKEGFLPISLGKRILRTETAAITTLSLTMMHLEFGENRAKE